MSEGTDSTAIDVGNEILGHVAAIEAMCKGGKIGNPSSGSSSGPSVEDVMANFDETLKDSFNKKR
jgi:hypothetical protein